MAVNEAGLFATLLNAKQSLGPEAGKRSRGELPLDALDFEAAADAAEALGETLEASAYRPFNLLIADPDAAFLLQNDGETLPNADWAGALFALPFNLNDPTDARFEGAGSAMRLQRPGSAPPNDLGRLATLGAKWKAVGQAERQNPVCYA